MMAKLQGVGSGRGQRAGERREGNWTAGFESPYAILGRPSFGGNLQDEELSRLRETGPETTVLSKSIHSEISGWPILGEGTVSSDTRTNIPG